MLIRIGFEIVFEVPAPAPMLLMLGLRPEREASVRCPGGLRVEPEAPVQRYTDAFGNHAARLLCRPGGLILRDDLIVEDGGQPDPVAPDAKQIPVQDLPPDVLVYLLSSRYCEVDRLLDVAWASSGGRPRAGAVSRRFAIGYMRMSGSTTSPPARPRPRMMCPKSGPGSAATLATWL